MSDAATPTFVRKGLLRLSWPLLVVTVLTLLATLGNVVLLSMSSPELNAAVAMSNQILGVMYDVSVLFSIGALVIIAQLLGAGRLPAAQRSSVIALRAASILGLVMAVVILLVAVHPAVGDGRRRGLLGARHCRGGEGGASSHPTPGECLAEPRCRRFRVALGECVTRHEVGHVTTARALFSHVEDLARLVLVSTPPRHRTPRDLAFARYLRQVRRIMRAEPVEFEVVGSRMLAGGPSSAVIELTLRTSVEVTPGDMLHVLWENTPERVEAGLARTSAGRYWSTPLPHRPARRRRYEAAELAASVFDLSRDEGSAARTRITPRCTRRTGYT